MGKYLLVALLTASVGIWAYNVGTMNPGVVELTVYKDKY